MQDKPQIVRLATRIYRLLLYAYPTPFRRHFGREMALLFRDDARDTLQRHGPLALVGLWLLAFFDLLKTALAEHIWEIFHMPLEKMERWSGPAAFLGGLIFAAGVIWSVGIDNGRSGNVAYVVLLLSFILSLPLLGLGLYGLYRRLPASLRPLNLLAFSVALGGLFLYTVGWLSVFVDLLVDVAVTVGDTGFVIAALGFTAMAIITLTSRALDRWSFAPLLSAASMVVIGLNVGEDTATSFWMALLSLYGLGWLLLGFALWITHDESTGPAMLA
jgi:hypothetical protein